MTIVSVGDSVTVVVEYVDGFWEHHLARAEAPPLPRWTLAVTHNGIVVQSQVFDSEELARQAALAACDYAIQHAEGVVFTWR